MKLGSISFLSLFFFCSPFSKLFWLSRINFETSLSFSDRRSARVLIEIRIEYIDQFGENWVLTNIESFKAWTGSLDLWKFKMSIWVQNVNHSGSLIKRQSRRNSGGASQIEQHPGMPVFSSPQLCCTAVDMWHCISLGLLSWLSGKESNCQCRNSHSVPGSGRSPEGGNGNPF